MELADNTSESYINGQRLVERDITCQNGYIQVLENVMNPLTNMAEAIHNDGELSTFSKMLDRFLPYRYITKDCRIRSGWTLRSYGVI